MNEAGGGAKAANLTSGDKSSQPGLFESIFGGANGKCDCKAKYEKQLKNLNSKMKSDAEMI